MIIFEHLLVKLAINISANLMVELLQYMHVTSCAYWNGKINNSHQER